MVELLSRLFVKNHRDVSSPAVRAAYGTMVSVVGIVLNILLFAAKLFVGTISASVAICADAYNNLSDAGSQVVSLISFRISAKPADREHPFGHARIEYVASMIVSFLILLVGVELVKESISKIISADLPERSWIAAAVLGGSVLVKLWLAILNRKIGKKINSSVMRATAADSLSDVLSTSAVLAATVIFILFPEMTFPLDAYMGVVVAIMILRAGIGILLETKNAILGEAPSEDVLRDITDVLKEYPAALGYHDMFIHNYGPGHTIVSLHVEVDGKADVFELHDMIDTIEQRLNRDYGMLATIHMDPIVTDDELVNSLRAKVADAVKNIHPNMNIHDFRFVSGETHSNLIFDVVAPFELKMTPDEIKRAVADEVSKIDPSYFVVITIDRG